MPIPPASDHFLVGRSHRMTTQAFDDLRGSLDQMQQVRSPRLSFMTEEHHRVRDFVVVELPRFGRALPPAHIAERTHSSLARTEALLEELESRRFFLVRDAEGQVSWAFPVTSEPTPHRVELSTGEVVNAA
jgi:hypothetical protein